MPANQPYDPRYNSMLAPELKVTLETEIMEGVGLW